MKTKVKFTTLFAGEERGAGQEGPRGPVQDRLRGHAGRVQQNATEPLLRGNAPNTRGLKSYVKI